MHMHDQHNFLKPEICSPSLNIMNKRLCVVLDAEVVMPVWDSSLGEALYCSSTILICSVNQ